MSGRTPKAPRVAHLSSAHPRHDNRIFWKECVTLADAGYEVCLVVADAAAPERIISGGVTVIAVRRRSGRSGRMLISTLAVLRAGLGQNADLYHFHDPELIPSGLALRLCGKRVVYDVHEDLPRDIQMKTWIPRRGRRISGRLAAAIEWVAGRSLSGIVAATPVIARRFPRNRTALVQNFARASEFPSGCGLPQPMRRSVAYVGAITEERCAFDMVEAIAGLKRRDVRLILAGEMSPPSLPAALAAQPGWERVDYRGYQDRPAVGRILSEACAGLAVFYPIRSYEESQPTKLFEYMAAGLPVIASDFPGFRAIIEEARCGICVPPRDVPAITSAIEWILGHPAEAAEMGRRGRESFERSFTWETQARALLDFYAQIFGGTRVLAPQPPATSS